MASEVNNSVSAVDVYNLLCLDYAKQTGDAASGMPIPLDDFLLYPDSTIMDIHSKLMQRMENNND